MSFRAELENKPYFQFILIVSLCILSVVVFSVIGGLITIVVYGIDMASLGNYHDPKVIEGLKLFQLFSAIGLFLVPPVIYGIISSKKPFEKLSLNRKGRAFNYVLVLLLMVASTPFLSWVIELNANMLLPDFLSGVEDWMRSSEDQASELTQAFLTFDGIGSLLYILLIVAVVPALGEELLFRGVLQKIIIKSTNKAHLGIWITAILFSALHMQFFGFFPRLLLGVVFGYIFYWSGSLWYSILGHFINNGSVVIISYFFPQSIKDADISMFDNNEYNVILYISSLIASLGILYLIRKTSKKQQVIYQNDEAITV